MPVSTSHNNQSTTPANRESHRWLIAILVVAGLLRLGVFCWKPATLLEDRDLYWGIAQHLAAGDGFVHPELGHPTAYRPPLYPILLALIVWGGGGVKSLAAVQIALSTATVWLTWRLGQRLNLGRRSLLAAGLVAINPLLVQATTLAMTETLFTFLVTASLLAANMNRWITLGVLLGLAALCRPTMFAVIAFSIAIYSVNQLWLHRTARGHWRSVSLTLIVCVSMIAPWCIRNWRVFGTPIMTTTHGGYTLLLGNNDEAYRAEVQQPFGTLWDSRPWQRTLEEQMQQAGISTSDEVSRDRWLSQQAHEWITSHPREFLESCWLRMRRFWNVSPAGSDAASLPRVILWGITMFFSIELAAAVVGLLRIDRDERTRWLMIVSLIISLFAVHIVYWSNMRMRTPLEPALSLLATTGFQKRRTAAKEAEGSCQ